MEEERERERTTRVLGTRGGEKAKQGGGLSQESRNTGTSANIKLRDWTERGRYKGRKVWAESRRRVGKCGEELGDASERRVF